MSCPIRSSPGKLYRSFTIYIMYYWHNWCSLLFYLFNLCWWYYIIFFVFPTYYRLLVERLVTLTEILDLGVLFRHNLSFYRHIDAAVAKAYYMLGFLKRVCRNVTNLKCWLLCNTYTLKIGIYLSLINLMLNFWVKYECA